MKVARLALVLAAVGAIAIACSDDETTGVTINDLVGDWDATAATLLPDGAPASAEINLISIGSVITISIAANGTYEFTHNNAVLMLSDTITGDFTLTGGDGFSLTNDDDPGDVLTGTFQLNGNTLQVTLPHAELADFDVPPDGQNDPALFEATFARQ